MFYNDAVIISYLLKYKITIRRSVGFPINTLDKVLEKLKDYKVSCVIVYGINNVISHHFIDNKYMEILYKAKKYDNVNDAVKEISKLSYEILCKDLKKYHDIFVFLRNL